MKKIKKKLAAFFKHIFVTHADHDMWIATSVVLFLGLFLFVLYLFQPEFNKSVNALLWGTQQAGGQIQQKLFKLPVTVVYNSSSTDQKTKMDGFLANMTDPTTALKDTELQTTWLDSKDPKAQQLISRSGLKYLPQVFIDGSIEQHPQFQALKQYLNKAGDSYFIRLAPLEMVQPPSAKADDHVSNDPNAAKVVIAVYERQFCDACADFQKTLDGLLKQYGKQLSVVYRHFDPGTVANGYAQGTECAGDQNKYFEMRQKLYADQSVLSPKLESALSGLADPNDQNAAAAAAQPILQNELQQAAKSLKLNMKDFQACLDSAKYKASIDAQTLDALNYGVNEPPTFFVNGKIQTGAMPSDQLKALIDAELKK